MFVKLESFKSFVIYRGGGGGGGGQKSVGVHWVLYYSRVLY